MNDCTKILPLPKQTSAQALQNQGIHALVGVARALQRGRPALPQEASGIHSPWGFPSPNPLPANAGSSLSPRVPESLHELIPEMLRFGVADLCIISEILFPEN